MKANELWQSFLQTGAPEMYLLYSEAKRLEEGNVPEGSRAGASGNSLS